MLNKEEYIDIIEYLDFFYGDNLIATAELRNEKSKEIQEKDLESYKQKLNCLKQLIKEHFELVDKYKELDSLHKKLLMQWGKSDNPPLKFEELKENMWCFDDKVKEYIFIKEIQHKSTYKIVSYVNYLAGELEQTYFEENRFYRREVKEDD